MAEEARAIGTIHQTDAEGRPLAEMERDVAAVVDGRATERRRLRHGVEDLIGHGARHGGHRGDEGFGREGHDRGLHAAGDPAAEGAADRIGLAPERGEFRAKLIEEAREASHRGTVSKTECLGFALRLDDEVDGAILQVQAAVGQQADLRSPHRPSPRTAAGSSGQGWPARCGT